MEYTTLMEILDVIDLDDHPVEEKPSVAVENPIVVENAVMLENVVNMDTVEANYKDENPLVGFPPVVEENPIDVVNPSETNQNEISENPHLESSVPTSCANLRCPLSRCQRYIFAAGAVALTAITLSYFLWK